jgi:choline dehydrogenase-like flavoprotein
MLRAILRFLLWCYWKLNIPFFRAFVETLLGYGEGELRVDGRAVVAAVDRFLHQVSETVFVQFILAVGTLPLVPPPALPRNELKRFWVKLKYAVRSFFSRAAFLARGREGRARFVDTMFKRLVAEAPAQEQYMVKTIVSLNIIKWILTMAYLDQPKVWEAIRYEPFHRRAWNPPTGPDLAHPPRSESSELLLREQQTPARVASKPPRRRTYVVVGSGAGGAVAARTLQQADKNARIVMIESGPLIANDQFDDQVLPTAARSYMNVGLTLSQDQQFIFQQGRGVGGSTVVNNSVAFTPEGFWWNDNIVKRWQALDVSLDWDDLYSQYAVLRDMLHVEEVDERIISKGSRTVKEGFERLQASGGWPPTKIVRAPSNVRQCIGCGRCNYACQYDAKQSMLTTLIPDLVRDGGLLVPGVHAQGLEIARRNGSRTVTGVWVSGADGEKVLIECDRCILAAGAYASSKLLWRSDFTGATAGVRTVGRRFSVNPGTPVIGIFPEPMNAFDGQQIGYAIEVPSERMVIETSFAPPGIIGMLVPPWGPAFQQRLAQVNNLAAAVPVIGALTYGEIKLGLMGDSGFVIDFTLIDEDWRRLEVGMKMSAQAMFEMGADEIFVNRFDSRTLKRGDDLDLYFGGIGPSDFIVVQSAHLQGGNVIGPQPYRGVVDGDLKVYGMDNLWICDASVIPQPISLNIALTVMALARYAALRIAHS